MARLNHDSSELDTLRDGLFAMGEEAEPRDDCPTPDRFWSAVRQELEPEQVSELLAHAVSCPVCTEAWRLARSLEADSLGQDRQPLPFARRGPRRRVRGWAAAAALAAGLVLAVGLGDWPWRTTTPSTSRNSDHALILSRVEEPSLPAEQAVLEWSGPPDATYGLRISTGDLRIVATISGLERPRYQVPRDALDPLPPGTRLLWQVTADLPDGRRLTSETFTFLLE